MTIGDVLAVIAAFFVVGASWAATILIFALAFQFRAAAAEQKIISSPGRCFLRGLVISIVVGVAALLLNKSHAGPVRIIAGALLTGLAVLAIVGSAGIVRLISDRIRGHGSEMTPFSTLTRGAILYVLAGFLPIFGWFLVLPVGFLISIGSAAALRTPPDILKLKPDPDAFGAVKNGAPGPGHGLNIAGGISEAPSVGTEPML